ncbi:MAG: hypothetical protein GX548_11690 [Lentisphaerae bacterium]|nr:hypothetical protein [Lentisphaerota bacterium]
MPKLNVRQIENIVSIDFWMAGLRENGSNLPPDLNDLPEYRRMVEQLAAVDATAVRIMPENHNCADLHPWPTGLGRHAEANLLKALVDGLRKAGFRSYYMTHAWISPFQIAEKMAPMPYKRWDYPYEQSDRLIHHENSPYSNAYPCVHSDPDFRDKWLALMTEVVSNGVDGVYIMPDEYYFKGHNLPKTDCPACQRGFQARFGFGKLPAKPEDTEAYRKWELFEYEKIDGVFRDVAARLKKIKPKLRVISNGNTAMVQFYNTQLEHSMAMDIQGADPSADAGDVYGGETLDVGGHAALCRRGAGAFGEGKMLACMQWLGITVNETPDPIKLYGYLLPHVMEGARYVTNYRLNYMFGRRENWPTVIAGFQRMRLLEAWGLGRSRTPAKACVLVSRASEDWWQVKMDGLIGGDAADSSRSTVLFSEDPSLGAIVKSDADARARELNYERFRGMAANKCVEGLLMEQGIPYAARFSERPDTLTNLNSYALLILPFSYSMSRETCAAVTAASEAGTKLLIVDQLAPTDEYGTAHPAPLLAELVGKPNVTFVKSNLAREGMKRSVRLKLADQIKALVGETGVRFDARGGQVEFLIREVDDGSRIVYLANWGYEPAEPALGLDLPDGSYRTTICGGDAVVLRRGLVDGLPEADATAFKRLSVPLAPREVVLAHIAPAAETTRAISKPCIAYKIMGAGRMDPRMALEYALTQIKPTDVVNVGMHRGDKDDMVEEDASIVRELLNRRTGDAAEGPG